MQTGTRIRGCDQYGPKPGTEAPKPPPPPSFTNLRITDWNGKPIAFGNSAHYACDRGFSFEEDPAQEEQTYTCQDGTAPDTTRGFFDVPADEEDWPRCVRGKLFRYHDSHKTCLISE